MKKILLVALCLCTITGWAQNEFYFNGSADVIFRHLPRGSGGRAFVHDANNMLSLNYEGDFTGGTNIGSTVHFKDHGNSYITSGRFGIGQTSPQGVLDLKINNSNLVFDLESNNLSKIISKGWNAGISLSTHQISGFHNLNQLYLHQNGFVGLGTDNPTAKLAVNGKIRAQEIKVESGPWPDYVFEDQYHLTDLQEIDQYIKVHKRLPGLPSAAEVQSNGIELGESNRRLVEKVEELTLHLIAKDRELKRQAADIEELRGLVKELKGLIKK